MATPEDEPHRNNPPPSISPSRHLSKSINKKLDYTLENTYKLGLNRLFQTHGMTPSRVLFPFLFSKAWQVNRSMSNATHNMTAIPSSLPISGGPRRDFCTNRLVKLGVIGPIGPTAFDKLGLDGPAGIHEVDGAGDHRRVVGCQEGHHLGNLKSGRHRKRGRKLAGANMTSPCYGTGRKGCPHIIGNLKGIRSAGKRVLWLVGACMKLQ